MHYKLQTHIILLLALLVSNHIPAQNVSYEVEHYSVDDGLPSHWVLSMIDHSSGFFWAGTTQGLCRFDGYGFSRIEGPEEYKEEFAGSITQMFEIDSGIIVMHTGLPSRREGETSRMRYNPETNTAQLITTETYEYLYEKKHADELRANDVSIQSSTLNGLTTTTYRDNFGNTIIATSYSSKPHTLEYVLATGERIDLTKEWTTFSRATSPTGKNFGNVTYWTSYNGLIKISIRRSPFNLILHEEAESWEYRNVCRAMCEFNKDSIMISVETRGEAIHDKNTNTTSFIDWNKDNLWRRPQNEYLRNFSLYGPEFDLYSSTWGAVVRMRPERAEKLRFMKSENKTLASGRLGIAHILAAKVIGSDSKYVLEVNDLSSQTMAQFAPERGADHFATCRPTYIQSVSDTVVWYGTKSGLFLLDIKHNEIKHLYLDKNAPVVEYEVPVTYCLAGPHVWVVHDSGDGKVWLGMDARGISVLNVTNNSIQTLTTSDGLPNNTVVGILPDDTGYWISTFNGLSHFDTSTAQFQNYFRSNGISHNEFNRFSFMKDSDGKYYFGSMNGITAFYPDDVLGSHEKLKLFLSEVAYHDTRQDKLVADLSSDWTQNTIVIPSMNRMLSLKMALSDFNNARGNTFFYRLENARGRGESSAAWSSLGRNNILRFENIEAGKYILHLKGISSTGVSSDEVKLSVKVKEVFYRTWWFLTSVALLLLAVFSLLHRARLSQALKIEKLRTRLSSDLHDDVGGLLSGVALQMEVLEHTVDKKHQSQVKRVAKSSRSAMEKMRDVVWAIDARQQSLQDLKERMLEFAEEVLSPLNYSYTVDTGDLLVKMELPSDVRHNLLLIYKEFVQNTIKHSEATHLIVKFNKTGKLMEMVLQDNGQGIESINMSRTGQGLRNMQMRAERMQGTFQYLEGDGFGVSILVPIK